MTNVDGRPRASARRVVARSSFGILLLAVPAALHAQTASQITPPSYAPPVERRPEAPLALPSDIIRQAPPGSESLCVTLGDLTVSGGTLAPQTMAMLRSRLIGKRISVAICTYDRYDLLPEAIGTAARQTLPAADYEILVVDNTPDEGRSLEEAFFAPTSGSNSCTGQLSMRKCGLQGACVAST